MNYATFSKGVKFVFVFTKKCFCVARDDLNNVPMEGLGSKSLRIHLESTKDVYMYTSLVIDYKVTMPLFYIVYDVQAQRRKGCPSLLALLLFEMI